MNEVCGNADNQLINKFHIINFDNTILFEKKNHNKTSLQVSGR